MKRVLITGGNKGIGLEISKLFYRNGFEVIVVARDYSTFSPELKDAVKKIQFDLSATEKIQDLVKEVGAIDVLINNSGIMNSLPFDNYPKDKKKAICKVNLEAPVTLIELFSKGMIAKGGGRIVSIASIAGEIGHPDIWYGITKAGVINFTKSFSKLLGQKGIVINCVAPSPVETTMYQAIPEERRKTILSNTVLNRPAKPEEIAQVVYWLATDSPEYINGTCIDINNTSFLR